MTWLAPKLRERVQILEAVQTPNNEGGMDRSYRPIITVWMGVKAVLGGLFVRGSQAEYVNVQLKEGYVSHEFIARRSPLVEVVPGAFDPAFERGPFNQPSPGLGRQFSMGFDGGFDSIVDLNPLKSEYFLLLERGNGRGRLFRIGRVMDVGERKEYLKIKAEEIEEHGTGYPE